MLSYENIDINPFIYKYYVLYDYILQPWKSDTLINLVICDW